MRNRGIEIHLMNYGIINRNIEGGVITEVESKHYFGSIKLKKGIIIKSF